MRTSSFLIAILCLSACYIATDTNQCVKRAVDQMTEQGRKQVLALTKGASREVESTFPVSELSKGRSLSVSRHKNLLPWPKANHWSSWGWASFSNKQQDLFGVYEQDNLSKTERALVKVKVTGCLKLMFRCMSGMRVPSCLSRKIKRECAFYQVFWGEKLAKKRKPSKKKAIKAAYMIYVRKALATKSAYNKLRAHYLRIRTFIEKSKKKPSKQLIKKVKLMLKNLRKFKKAYQKDRAKATQMYRTYVVRMKKAHQKPAKFTELANLLPLPKLPKDKRGHFMRIFLDESNRKLYYLYRRWARHYIRLYKYRWNALQGAKDTKKNYKIIYKQVLQQLQINKRSKSVAWRVKYYRGRLRYYNKLIAKRTKVVQDYDKKLFSNLQNMREQFNNPEVDYLVKTFLFKKYSNWYLHALRRYMYAKRAYFGYLNTMRYRRGRRYAYLRVSGQTYLNEARTYQRLISEYRGKRDKANRERLGLFTKLRNADKFGYDYDLYSFYENKVGTYAPLALSMKRTVVEYKNFWVRTHRRNPYYSNALGLYSQMSKIYNAELKSALANSNKYRKGFMKYFKSRGGWTKFYYSWILFRSFYWQEETNTMTYLFEETKAKAYQTVIKFRSKSRRYRNYRYYWNGYLEYFKASRDFHKKRATMFTKALGMQKRNLLKWYKKQSSYNKAYWMRRMVSSLQFNWVEEWEGLKLNSLQKKLRFELLGKTDAAGAAAQRVWIRYNNQMRNYYVARMKTTKNYMKLFQKMSKIKGVKISGYSELGIIHEKDVFLRNAYKDLWRKSARMYNEFWLAYRHHTRFRSRKTFSRYAAAFHKKARAFLTLSNQYRIAYLKFQGKTYTSQVKISKHYVGQLIKGLPGIKKQLSKYTKLTAKYLALAQHHPSNRSYRKLLKRYHNMKKLYVYRVAQRQRSITYNKRVYQNYKRILARTRRRRGRRLGEAFVEDLELKGAATVEKLSEFSQILFKHVKEFSDRRDRRLILNCF